MGISIRCRITGCDLDECGICRRCGDSSKEKHQWSKAVSEDPCYRMEVCDRCQNERRHPNHDWQSSPSDWSDAVTLKCSRCGLTI